MHYRVVGVSLKNTKIFDFFVAPSIAERTKIEVKGCLNLLIRAQFGERENYRINPDFLLAE